MRNLGLLLVLMLQTAILPAKAIQILDSVENQSLFNLMSYQEIQEVTLEIDLNGLLSDRRNEDSFKGLFSFEDENGQLQSWKTGVELRGKFRRSRCEGMPPLKLNFKKGDLAKAGLTLHDDFKLVTQCVEDDSQAKTLLMKEYLAYKIYNELTAYSFRVQLLKINFKDKATGRVDEQWGFIIEDTSEMRARLGAEKYDAKFGIKTELVNQAYFKRMALFQYMIGNLDWDLYKKAHNVKLIKKGAKVIAIPYDFDFSGMVSASYARLNPNYKVNSIKDRVYLGRAEDLQDMQKTVGLFESEKENILQLVKDFKPLKREERRAIIDYINSFYRDINDIRIPEKNIASTAELSIHK